MLFYVPPDIQTIMVLKNTSYNEKEPFKIYGPGSYEIDGNSFVGYGGEAKIDSADFMNTIYFFTLEGISFCFLGVPRT